MTEDDPRHPYFDPPENQIDVWFYTNRLGEMFLAWARALTFSFVSVLLFCSQSFAEEREGLGVICDTASQIETYATFKGDHETALMWVNTHEPGACGIIEFRYLKGDVIKKITLDGGEVTSVMQIALTAIKQGNHWLPATPATYFILWQPPTQGA